MTTTFDARRAPDNGSEQIRLEPPPGRRARVPELVVGAALMVGFALAAVLWHMSATDKEPALALAAPISRGEAIEAADLRVVYVASDGPIARLGEREAQELVGRVAVSDLPAGTLVTSGILAPRLTLAPGEGLVGLALDPGQVPSSELAVGDLVNVIAGPGEGGALQGGALQAEDRPTAVLASGATVYATEDLRAEGRRFVSVKLPEADANRVAAAAERGPVRLVLVGR